jgi:TolB-like protein/DNA-binding winged helix-turn-helix (wHTH) protein
MEPLGPKSYEFGRFRLDPGRRVLLDGDGGPVEMSAKAFDVLVFLVQNAGRVVTRTELMDAIWPKAIVEENTLSQVVLRLRQAIGDGYIVTIKGRGYQFVENVRFGRSADGPGDAGAAVGARTGQRNLSGPRPYALVATVVAAVGLAIVGAYRIAKLGEEQSIPVGADVVSTIATANTDQPDPRSIAVLPFANLSVREEDAFFAQGMHSELLTRLAKVGSLKPTWHESVLEYRDANRNLREIGAALDVAWILEGAVQRQRTGDRMRVNVQLIDAQTEDQVWAETYDREATATNLLAIQTEIATSIATELDAMLLPDEAERLADVPTRSSRAYDFYLSARDYESREWTAENLALAILQCERALEEDDQFALAWARLAILHSETYVFDDPSETRGKEALKAVETALELQPTLPEAHYAKAWYLAQIEGDYEAALNELAIAADGMPGDAMLYSMEGFIHVRSGRWDDALAAFDRAGKLNPRAVGVLFEQVIVHVMRRDYASAERYNDRILDLQPDHVPGLTNRIMLPLFWDGDVSLARAAAVQPAYGSEGDRFFVAPADLGWLAALYDGDHEASIGHLDAWDVDDHDSPGEHVFKASLYGISYELLNQPDQARLHFRTAADQVEAELERYPEDPDLWIALGEALAWLDETEAAVAAARNALEIEPLANNAVNGPMLRLDAARRVLLPAGAFDEAFAELDAYFAAPGFWSIEGILSDPRLDPVREDPRFVALVERYRRPRGADR